MNHDHTRGIRMSTFPFSQGTMPFLYPDVHGWRASIGLPRSDSSPLALLAWQVVVLAHSPSRQEATS